MQIQESKTIDDVLATLDLIIEKSIAEKLLGESGCRRASESIVDTMAAIHAVDLKSQWHEMRLPCNNDKHTFIYLSKWFEILFCGYGRCVAVFGMYGWKMRNQCSNRMMSWTTEIRSYDIVFLHVSSSLRCVS